MCSSRGRRQTSQRRQVNPELLFEDDGEDVEDGHKHDQCGHHGTEPARKAREEDGLQLGQRYDGELEDIAGELEDVA